MLSEKNINFAVLLFLGLTLIVGFWHGFPITNVVADEGFFSGAVLRSLEAHTLMPLPLDVPYGTITFYLSYAVITLGLSILLVCFGFNFEALKLFIIENPHIVYGLARLVSVAIGIFCLLMFAKVLKKYIEDFRVRMVLLVSLFGTMLVNIIFHTSKVWVLSTLLLLGSFYFLTRLLESGVQKKWIWATVTLAFLSFANFPFMGLALINLPILVYFFWKNKEARKTILISTAVGAVIFLVIVLSNFSGIKAQVYSILFDYTFYEEAKIYNVTFWGSAYLHLKKIILLFPVLLATLVCVGFKKKIKHQKLFWLSLGYIFLYVSLIIIVDRWSTTDKSSIRYLFPVPFFMTALIASLDIKWSRVLWVPVMVTLVYLLPTLYFLSIPTTSHHAISYVRENYKDDTRAVFINHVGADTPLPQNKSSYLLSKPAECASKCKVTIEIDLGSGFKPLSLDDHTDPSKLQEAIKNKEVYYVERAATTSPHYTLVRSFTNQVEDRNYFSADNSGTYFDLGYFKLKNYGPNIYIYKLD